MKNQKHHSAYEMYKKLLTNFWTVDVEDLDVFKGKNEIPAPTYSQAFRWFKEEYALDSQIRVIPTFDVTRKYQFNINGDSDDVWYKTYEEAAFACLSKLIEIINEK